MAKHPDVAVVGGGIIGLTCAYHLARAGLAVEVFDRGDLGKEASWAGAGILPPGNPAGAATPIDVLRAIGSERFPGFSAELRELTGVDNGYLWCGGVEFLGSGEAADVLPVWRNEGIAFERLSLEGLRRLEPAVGDVPGEAYLLPGCAQVRNPRHLRALIASCERLGVGLHPHTPVEGVPRDRAGRVLLATGAWAGRGVYPVRGQIVLLKTPAPTFTRVLMLGKRYLVPRVDGHVLVGSTEEPEAGFEKANTAAEVADLVALAVRTVPALAAAERVRCWAGLRPGTPDGLPFIGPVPGWDNVFVAAGHFRAGVQLSIGTAQLVTELFTGRPTCVPPAAFALDRPPHAGGPAAFRS
ncbi:MAG: glycine oxidase ThiO [Isosphaera sp.]|nr:glycine oxidase ThiO [Isosphaera sp.]